MDGKLVLVVCAVVLAKCAASSIGGERVKEFEFSPRIHSDSPTGEASFFVDDSGIKLSVCDAYKVHFAQHKPKRSICNVKCETQKTVKCTLHEIEIPECNEYAAHVYKRILQDFDLMNKEKGFACEIPTAKNYKIKPRVEVAISSEKKMSRFCREYKKSTKESDFEFPCYVKCDSYIVGVSLDGNKPDWELSCESYQQACTFGSSDSTMSVGNMCEAFRQYVLSKVKLGEADFHHCNVYNHGPQYDYFNKTMKN